MFEEYINNIPQSLINEALEDKKKGNRSDRIEIIYRLIMELASGNLTYRAHIKDGDNELDAIALGINMLAEELQHTTVSKNYLSRIYRGVVDMLIILSPDHTIQQVNSALCSSLGYNEEDLLNRHISILFARSEKRSLSRIDKELEKNGSIYNMERVLRSKDGKNVPVSMSCSLLYDDKQKINGLMYVAKDISKIKKTEFDLRQKNEALNTLIYRSSHDLKGPLTSIMGLIQLAKQDIYDIDSMKNYLGLIEQSTKRLDNILNAFLDLGQLSNHSVKNSNVYLNRLIPEIIESLEEEREGINIRFSCTQKKPFITKKSVIVTIIKSLVENAIRFKKPELFEPEINIEAIEKDNFMHISIKDNGLGMDRNVLPHIFKMFYRGHESSKGNGLGLYIVKTGVDALRGKIKVLSRKNHGTTFILKLPMQIQ